VREQQQGAERGAGRVADQARQLEQRVIGQNENVRARDVRVEREGDTLRTELTPTGAERFGLNPTGEERMERFRARLPDEQFSRNLDVADLDRDTQQQVNESLIEQRSSQLSASERRQRQILGPDGVFGLGDIENLNRETQQQVNESLIGQQRALQLGLELQARDRRTRTLEDATPFEGGRHSSPARS